MNIDTCRLFKSEKCSGDLTDQYMISVCHQMACSIAGEETMLSFQKNYL